jgi:short-subunit dehydrogenase
VEDLSRDAIRIQFETNLFGTIELINRVIPVMRKQGFGRIIQCSSIHGFVALPYRGAYIASKYALEGLTDTLRLELSKTPIRVSLIEPGPITTSYKFLEDRLSGTDSTSSFRLPPKAVLRKVMHALESESPKIRYHVTFPTHLFAELKRILPDFMLDKILLKAFDGGKRCGSVPQCQGYTA